MIELSSDTISIKISAHHDLTDWAVRTKIIHENDSIVKANAKENWGSDGDVLVDTTDPSSFVLRFHAGDLDQFKNKNDVLLYIELESPDSETLAVQQDTLFIN